MKMVKSLLLGSAAGVVAASAGQAADLPVKAKPVEYVKVCNLYGAGFYYMPGTDMCIKIGGWVRAEYTYGGNGNMAWGPYNNNAQQQTTNNSVFRARGYITADAREQTAYGTARAYIAVGIATNDVGFNGTGGQADTQVSINRAFLQWAGITAGIAQSFYDFYSGPAASYRAGYFPNSDTGDPGWFVWGYTAQLGNGLTATLAAEARRTTQIIDQNAVNGFATNGVFGSGAGGNLGGGVFDTLTASGFASATGLALANGLASGAQAVFPSNGAYGGFQAPDIVANLRLDQTWGGAQIMGALHELNTNYYSTTATGLPSGAVAPSTNFGHPATEWGWAVGAGLRLNFPMIAQGDYFQTQFNYTQGALRYLFFTPNSNWGKLEGQQQSYGVLSDCVYGGTVASGTATSCQMTTAYGFNASYEHYWTPQWHESFFGAYYKVQYDQLANNMLCSAEFGLGTVAAATGSGTTSAVGACNNNWSTWALGSRLQWDVTKSFYLGVEVLYDNLHSAVPFSGPGGLLVAPGTATSSGLNLGSTVNTQKSDMDNWAFTLRMHKDFLP
jgi:hypothetical protein